MCGHGLPLFQEAGVHAVFPVYFPACPQPLVLLLTRVVSSALEGYRYLHTSVSREPNLVLLPTAETV